MSRCTVILVIAPLIFAMPVAKGQQPQDAAHAPDGSTVEYINNIDIPPLANAPFTANVTAEWTRKLEDGGTQTISNHRKIARDNSGRIFQERRWLIQNGDKNGSPLTQLEFADVTLHEINVCLPSIHTCRLRNYNVPAEFHLMQPGELPNHKGNLVRKDLGRNTLEGVEVVGTRETLTFDANTVGNSQPLVITKEFWYSQQLGINLLVKRVDPRHGTQIFSVSDLKLGSPDAAIFRLPEGYAIQDLRTQPGQQAAPASPR